MVIKTIIRANKFERNLKSIKDNKLKERIKKQITKIINNPEIGKPLRYSLKNERTIYIKPFRLIYAVKGEYLYLLRFSHRDEAYR
jgi:mRNA-degrading endonuclease RelE of RelBE toxin-antitoxin system